jgi:hypothetical protein
MTDERKKAAGAVDWNRRKRILVAGPRRIGDVEGARELAARVMASSSYDEAVRHMLEVVDAR